MPKEKYKNNIMYLFKRDKGNTASYSVEGIPFYCDKMTKKKSIFNPQSNTYKSQTVEIIKTTTQLEFEEFDKVSDYIEPTVDDFSIIQAIEPIPYLQKGNKHRTVQYWERTIEIS